MRRDIVCFPYNEKDYRNRSNIHYLEIALLLRQETFGGIRLNGSRSLELEVTLFGIVVLLLALTYVYHHADKEYQRCNLKAQRQ